MPSTAYTARGGLLESGYHPAPRTGNDGAERVESAITSPYRNGAMRAPWGRRLVDEEVTAIQGERIGCNPDIAFAENH